MGMIIGMVGFLGFPACLIAFIVSAIKKKPKKKSTTGMLVCLAMFIVGMSIDSHNTDGDSAVRDNIPPAPSDPVVSEIEKESLQPNTSPVDTKTPEPSKESSEVTAIASEQVSSQETILPVQAESPAPLETQSPATTVPTTEPTETSELHNPVVTGPEQPTTSPSQQTPAPTQVGNGQTVPNNDGTYTHDFSGGRVLATMQSNNNGDPVYHIKDCRAAKIIPPENEYWYESEQAAKNDGRRLCGYCNK